MNHEEAPIYTEEDVVRHAAEQQLQRRNAEQWIIFKCFLLMVVITAVLAIANTVYRGSSVTKISDDTVAISNARQVYLVLLDFEADYGCFPDDHTALKDPSLNGFTGSYSNDYLGQLIAGGYTKSEEIFYALDKRYRGAKPNDVTSPPSKILENNECGFSYVMVEEKGKRRGLNTKDNSGIPILVAPMVNQQGASEKTSYGNKAVYLRVDGAASRARLRASDQKIQIGGGKTLFDSGPGTLWGSLKPVILLPKR